MLSGHEHAYERFAPQDADGNADPARGIRQFVVGTGGKSHTELTRSPAGLRAASDDTFGVLKLTLHRASYDWAYVTEDGLALDSGSAKCSGQRPGPR